LAFCLASRSQILEKETYTHGEDNPDHGALPTFSGGDEGEFLGGCLRTDQAVVEGAAGVGFAAGAGPVCGTRGVPAAEQPARALPQRLLRAGFRDPFGHDPAAHSAHPGQEFSAARAGTVPAARGGCIDADPGSVCARHLDAAGGAGGSHADRRGGEPADGIEADPRSGRSGAAVSPGRGCKISTRIYFWME
jgi:hypothetical protein